MNQIRLTTREQAERMAGDRLRTLINHYPNPNSLKGQSDGEVYRKLEICYGKEYVYRATHIPTIEGQIKSRIKRFIVGTSVVIVGFIAWGATLLSMWAIPALQSKSGDIQTWSAVIATVIVAGVFGWWITRNVRAMIKGSWNIKMDKR